MSKRVFGRALAWIEARTGLSGRRLLPAVLVLVFMLFSLILFIALKNKSHDPGGFGVPDDFDVLTMETMLHPQSPLAPAVSAWKRGAPWVAIDLLRDAMVTKLSTDEHRAALNYTGHIRIWLGDLAAAGASFQAGLALHKNAGSLYGLGRVAELTRDYPTASRYYLAAVETRSDFALAWRRLGDVRRVQSDVQGAVDAYKRSLEVSSLDLTRYRLGVALTALGQVEAARQHFQYLLENAKSTYLIGFSAARLGDIEDGRGDLKRASELYQQAVRACPDQSAFRHNLGGLLIKAGQVDEAMSVYLGLRAENLRKKNPDARDEAIRQSLARTIGETWYDRDDTTAALRFLAEAGKDDPEVAAMLGDLYFVRGEYDDALSYYGRVIATAPLSRLGLVALVNTGTIWLQRMQPERALVAWKKALEIERDNPRILCNTGLALLALKETKAAGEVFLKAWRIDTSLTNALAALAAVTPAEKVIDLLRSHDALGKHWYTLHTLGRLYHRKRAYGSALEALRRAIGVTRVPSEADASRILLARALFAQDKPDQAEKELSGLRERMSQDGLWLYQMGLIAWKSGSQTNALRYFSLADQPKNTPRLQASILYWLGNCYWKEGALAKALEYYRSALRLDPAHTAAAYNASFCVQELAAGRQKGRGGQHNERTKR